MSTYLTDHSVSSEAERRLLAEALDSILRGQITRAADLLSCQFKGVEMAQREGGWHAAKHLNPVSTAHVSAVDDDEREDLYKQERHDLKNREMVDRVRRRGSPGHQERR